MATMLTEYSPNSTSTVRTGAALGIDIGGTKLAVGLLRENALVVPVRMVETRTTLGASGVIDDIVELASLVVADAGIPWSTLAGIGVGCGGPLDAARGVIYSPPNLPGWDEYPLVEELASRFGIEPALGNDGDVAALAEFRLGGHRVEESLVYFTVSTGCGGGVILNGELLTGASGSAGEFGHILSGADNRPCACGQRGCLEAYASGPSIASSAVRGLIDRPESSLARLANIRAEDVVAHARAGDPLAAQVWQEAIDALANAVRTVANSLDPEIVVLGGGVTRAGDALFGPLREKLAGTQFRRPSLGDTPVVPSALADNVGVFGAALLALEER